MDTIKHYFHKLAVSAAVSLLMISTSLSDDVDVYINPTDAATPGQVLVIFTLDLRSDVLASSVCTGTDDNGNNECLSLFQDVGMEAALNDDHVSFLELLTAALKKVLGRLNDPAIKVALMIPHDDTGGNKVNKCLGYVGNSLACSNGAYVLSAFKSAVQDDPDTDIDEGAELDEFFEKLESIPLKEDGGQWSHDYQLKELFFEMYRYITSGDVYNGENGLDDFDTKNDLNIDHPDDTISVHPDHDETTEPIAELKWDGDALTNPSDHRYEGPLISSAECTTLYSVNLVKGTANKDDDSDAAIEAAPPGGMGLSLDNSSFRSRVQVLEYLANVDLAPDLLGEQNINSYFVTLESGGSGGSGGRANDWAQAGGTTSSWVVSGNPEKLVDEFSELFGEIVGVSTTFVAASVPANVFNRAETLNEVFLAIFEPDVDKNPFWIGNVKKLTTTTIDETVSCEDLNNDGDTLDEGECTTEERKILVDVLEAGKPDPNSAISPDDGRIRAGALTYWTRTGSDNQYLDAPTTEEDEKEFLEGSDGRKVDRGGAGQVKPGYLGIGTPGDPGETNASNTTIEGPRRILTEPESSTDGTSDDLVGLEAATVDLTTTPLADNTADELLTDGRWYPGTGDTLTYGDFLFQTVMECSECTYAGANSDDQTTARRRVSNLIRFARGWNVGLDESLSTTVNKRAWWQADPLHSRPLALNYGGRDSYTADDPDIRVIVAGNDGMVQMIRDGRTPSSLNTDGSPEDGVEAWAFLPREFMPLQKRLLEGTKGAYFPGQPVTDDPITDSDDPRTPLHPYAMDGAPTALVIDNNLDGTIDSTDPENDRVYLYTGQRRGGKRYYALDLSDPDDPKYLWSIGKDDADFTEMAQSWSLMRAGIMAVDHDNDPDTSAKNQPVLVFSGGYNGDDGGDGDGDLGKDSRVEDINGEIVGADDLEGNALFIVNALTGELIWKAAGPPATGVDGVYDTTSQTLLKSDLVDSVASSPTIVDSNGDGLIDRVYFPDTGGNVWRMDVGSPSRSTWQVNKLFSSGRHITADNANDRRFFNAPDVVFASDDNGDFDAVILASGDRAHPLDTDVENWIYMIKDRNTASGVVDATDLPLEHGDLADLTDNCLQGGDINNCNTTQQDNIDNGWKIKLLECEAGGTGANCGEKSLASPLTIEGTIFLTTYLPVLEDEDTTTLETCGPKEGSGLFYALDLQTAGGVLDFDPTNNTSEVTGDRFDKLKSPGIPPEPVAISPNEILRPDLQIQKTEGRKSAKTFWYDRRFQ